jgi:MFS transporter, DHA1 family, inner membrane transport protein
VLAATLGWRGVFAFSAVITTIAALMVLVSLKPTGRKRQPLSLSGAVGGYREVMRNPRSRIVYFMVASEGVLVFGSFPFIAPLLELHGTGSVMEAGFVITGFAIGGLVYTGLVGFLLRTVGQRAMMAMGALLGGTSLALAGLPLPWVGTALLFFGLGLGFFTVHNTLQTEASELAPRVRASAFAVFASLFFLGQGLGVVVVREGAAIVGLPNMMASLGVLVAALGLFGAWAIGRPRVA